MKVTILPSKAVGSVMAPPSKSASHRALICGALSRRSCINNLAYSQDILATLRCLESMGASVERYDNRVIIGGMDPYKIPAYTILDCGESGSTLRFLLPLCLLAGVPIRLVGRKRLMERPLSVYEDICQQQNLQFDRTDDGITVCGRLRPGAYTVPGNISSQFITGLMLALSLLDGDSSITVTEPFESESYVSMTEKIQRAFGIAVALRHTQLSVGGNGVYHPAEYTIEGDCSNAAFLEGFNLLGGDVKVSGLSPTTVQGDRIYEEYYRRLAQGEPCFDLADCPDLGPVMFTLAAACGGGRFTGTARLRIKESDRVAAMVAELHKFGVTAAIESNAVAIHPAVLQTPNTALCGHNDHRIVMALSLLCSLTGGTIEGAEAVSKSFPNYFDALKSLGIELSTDDI